jgi:hypothetical protein
MRCPNCHTESTSKFCPECGTLLQQRCPRCQALSDPGHKFCENCGAPLGAQPSQAGKPAGATTIGDIGLIRGTLDASTHIGSQTNISGPVTMNVQAPQPDLEDLLHRGRQLLESRAYRGATKVLQDAVRGDPSNARASLFLALALLQGRNPDVVRPRVIQQSEASLLEAIQDQDTRAVALVALGVIKHDHYLANGMSEGYPTLDQIVRELRATSLSAKDRQLLRHLKASPRAKKLLETQW